MLNAADAELLLILSPCHEEKCCRCRLSWFSAAAAPLCLDVLMLLLPPSSTEARVMDVLPLELLLAYAEAMTLRGVKESLLSRATALTLPLHRC
jgi:hypothetical protein